jgi:hypothetical protein
MDLCIFDILKINKFIQIDQEAMSMLTVLIF